MYFLKSLGLSVAARASIVGKQVKSYSFHNGMNAQFGQSVLDVVTHGRIAEV